MFSRKSSLPAVSEPKELSLGNLNDLTPSEVLCAMVVIHIRKQTPSDEWMERGGYLTITLPSGKRVDIKNWTREGEITLGMPGSDRPYASVETKKEWSDRIKAELDKLWRASWEAYDRRNELNGEEAALEIVAENLADFLDQR